MLRGEVWYAVWPADPAQKVRPVLIVSNNFRNSASHLLDIVVVKLTGLYRDNGTQKPTNAAEDVVVKFKKETIIRCAGLFAIEKNTLRKKVSQLSSTTLQEVDEKLKHVLDLDE